jgi:hypothetical protein
MLAITYKKITKIKVAEWGTPKKGKLKKKKKLRMYGSNFKMTNTNIRIVKIVNKVIKKTQKH